MELVTIWTLPASDFGEKVSRTQEWAWRKAAHHLPRRLAYWSFIDSGVRYMNENDIVPDVTYLTVLERHER